MAKRAYVIAVALYLVCFATCRTSSRFVFPVSNFIQRTIAFFSVRRLHTAPLIKLRPYGAIQMCILLLLLQRSHLVILRVTTATAHNNAANI